MMLDNVGLSLNWLKIFVQHRATLLARLCCMMLASSEQALALHNIFQKCWIPVPFLKYMMLGHNIFDLCQLYHRRSMV